ncbi:MAG TPA: hypothetical protein DCP07_04790 [Lachnospiraceae bacterium]|nr:hypothetical protein [Lachnospiraceae bacterium]
MKKIFNNLLSVVLIFATLFSFSLDVGATEDKRYRASNIDEQRAVNLTASQLVNWANIKGYNTTCQVLTDSYGTSYTVFYVLHTDTKTKALKGLTSAGKKAIDIYTDGILDASVEFLFDDTDEKYTDYVDDKATESLLEDKNLLSIADTFYNAYMNCDPQIISAYVYYDLYSPAKYGVVFKPAYARAYSVSKGWNDFCYGTTDGFSKKKEKKNKKFGYYYMQNKVSISGDDYWEIIVLPYDAY